MLCPPPPNALTFIVKVDVLDAVSYTDQVVTLVDNHAMFFGNSRLKWRERDEGGKR